jgi:hypothetical protein
VIRERVAKRRNSENCAVRSEQGGRRIQQTAERVGGAQILFGGEDKYFRPQYLGLQNVKDQSLK